MLVSYSRFTKTSWSMHFTGLVLLCVLVGSPCLATGGTDIATGNDWALVRGAGINALAKHDFVYSEKCLKRALKLASDDKRDDPRIVTSLNDLADMYAKEKKYAQARANYQKVLKLEETRYGASNIAIIPALNNVIKVTCAGGLCYDTIPELKRLLEIRQTVNGPVSKDVPATLLLLGEAYEKHGDFPEALKYFRRAAAVQTQLTGATSPMALAYNKNIERVEKECKK